MTNTRSDYYILRGWIFSKDGIFYLATKKDQEVFATSQRELLDKLDLLSNRITMEEYIKRLKK